MDGQRLEIWGNCAKNLHSLCAVEVMAQQAWTTAGLDPPSPFADPLVRIRCCCPCHSKEVRS